MTFATALRSAMTARNDAPFPRIAHVERHIREHCLTRGTREDALVLLPYLLQPLTNDEIGRELGWSRGLVEHAWVRIRDMLALRSGRTSYGRIELIRLVMGLDPCWCEQ